MPWRSAMVSVTRLFSACWAVAAGTKWSIVR